MTCKYTQKMKILAALRCRAMTRHALRDVTRIPLETVCRRVAELMESGRIEVSRSVLCETTGQYREVLRIRRQERRVA